MPLNNSLALLDTQFLKQLDQQKDRIVWCRIISLNWNEESLANITGRAVSGSISVTGTSAVRRTCSLSLITDQPQIDTATWALRTKFKVEIGLNNFVDDRYEDIIWFPQGTYIITSFNTSMSDSTFTVSIQGKDKMCLLNGEIGGNLFASHEFAKVWTQHDDGSYTKELIPIYTIIKEAIHAYGQEPYYNIIINDLDIAGVELLDYIGNNQNMYIYEVYHTKDNGRTWNYHSANIRFGKDLDPYNANSYGQEQDELCRQFLFATQQHQRDYEIDDIQSSMLGNSYKYKLKKCAHPGNSNTCIGYRATDLTYTGELTIPVGGSITSMLDKLVEMLGEFEYFYNTKGQFVFQRKRIYFNSQWSNVDMEANTQYYERASNSDGAFYEFVGDQLLTSISNSPKISAIKNDYAIWGKKTSASQKEWPIHLRYAIDRKPTKYYSLLDERMYVSNQYEEEVKDSSDKYRGQYDWRELIYQMARDNLASSNRIEGLTYALRTIFNDEENQLYHYDYAYLNAADYANYYQFNAITKKFVALENQGQFESCKDQNVFLYGFDIGKAKKALTQKEMQYVIEHLGYDYRIAATEQYLMDLLDDVLPNSEMSTLTSAQQGFIRRWKTSLYSGIRRLNNFQIELNPGIVEEILGESGIIQEYGKLKVIAAMQDEVALWENTFNTGYDAYYADMLEFWPKIYRTKQRLITTYDDVGNIAVDENGDWIQNADDISDKEWKRWVLNGFWNPDYLTLDYDTGNVIFKEPEALWFWIDFADPYELPGLFEFAVEVVGRRTDTLNDDKIKALYFRPTPSLLFITPDAPQPDNQSNLQMVRINLTPTQSNYISISSQGKSAKEMLDSRVYDGTYYQESINISCVPIYYMEPNVRIAVNDNMGNVHGQFIVQSFTIPLAYDGLMSITASRTDDRDRLY